MGRHRDEIWAELRDLDDRVTRLEERATPQAQPRLWKVGDVVRLEEANGYNMKFVGELMTIIRVSDDSRYAYFTDGPWPASALTLIRAAGEPQSCADLQREVERLRWEYGAQHDYILNLQSGISNKDVEIANLTAERDALRARIEAGRIMYGGMYGHENKFEIWTFEHVNTDTMTARLIDIAPIAADERKGERRVAKLTAAIHRNVRMNDRRRTPGTRADRGES